MFVLCSNTCFIHSVYVIHSVYTCFYLRRNPFCLYRAKSEGLLKKRPLTPVGANPGGDASRYQQTTPSRNADIGGGEGGERGGAANTTNECVANDDPIERPGHSHLREESSKDDVTPNAVPVRPLIEESSGRIRILSL